MEPCEIARCTGIKQRVVDKAVSRHGEDTRAALASIVQTLASQERTASTTSESGEEGIWDDPEALENDMNQMKINGVLFETYRRVQEVEEHLAKKDAGGRVPPDPKLAWTLLRKYDWTPAIAIQMHDFNRIDPKDQLLLEFELEEEDHQAPPSPAEVNGVNDGAQAGTESSFDSEYITAIRRATETWGFTYDGQDFCGVEEQATKGSKLQFIGRNAKRLSMLNKDTPVGDVPLDLLSEFVRLVEGEGTTPAHRLFGTTMIRKLISVEVDPPLDRIIESGVCKALVGFLARDQEPDLQCEAAWVFTNIASGRREHSNYVLSINACIGLVALLHPDRGVECQEQAVWALGNLVGDSVRARDYVLGLNPLPPLLQMVRDFKSCTAGEKAIWCLSNMCRGNPPPVPDHIKPIVQLYCQLLTPVLFQEALTEDALADVFWGLSYIANGPPDRVAVLVEDEHKDLLVTAIVRSIGIHSPPAKVAAAILRLIGGISTGPKANTDLLVDHGVLPALRPLFHHPKKSVRTEVCWVVGNIAVDQTDLVISSKLVEPLLECLKSGEAEVICLAAESISNIAVASPRHLAYLISVGTLEVICTKVVDHQHLKAKTLFVLLNTVLEALRDGERLKIQHEECEGANPAALILLEHEDDVISSIEYLQLHRDTAVTRQVRGILEYFAVEEDSEEGEEKENSHLPQ